MIQYAFAAILLLLTLLAMTLEKAYFYVPYRELKRLAAKREFVSETLFQAAAYGDELKLLLFTVMGLSAAGGFVLLSLAAPAILSFVVVGLVLLFAYIWLPRTHLTHIGAQAAIWSTPAMLHALRVLHPASSRITPWLARYRAAEHTGMYEKDDVVAMLEQQLHQSDNRMSSQELGLMQSALQFGDYTVGDIVVPQRKVKSVSIDEDISPVFLAELHEAGHARFPVYEGKKSNIVGTLDASMVADVRQHGKVRDNFDHHLAYVHEQDSLIRALRAFYETRQHLFIVVNKLDEYVGIITLSDILQKLFGAIEHEAFGHHDDRQAVAYRHDHKASDHAEAAENPSTNSTEVVE